MQNVKPGDTLLIKNGEDIVVTKIVKLPRGLFPYMVYDAVNNLPIDFYQENGLSQSDQANSVIGVTRTCEPIGRADSDWRHDLGVGPQYCRVADDEPKPSGGVKFDTNKPDYSLLTRAMLEPMARGFMYGAAKYGRYNHKGGMDNIRLIAAALRHIFAYNDGEDLDAESGNPHLGHAMCAIAMILDNEANGTSTDGRYAK